MVHKGDRLNFQDAKLVVMQVTNLEKDALHIYVGLTVYLVSLVLTQRWIDYPIKRKNVALITVSLATLAGEILDLHMMYPHIRGRHLDASIHDFINTIFWPFVLYALGRWSDLLKE